MKYTKAQISKAITHWKKVLESFDDVKVDIIDDLDTIKELLPTIVGIVVKTYRPIGGYYGNTNANKLSRTTSLMKIVKNDDESIAACAFYRNVNGSFKIQAYGNDGTDFGKVGVKAIIKTDVSPYDNWVWGEVSGPIEHYFKKFEGYPLPNEFVVEVLGKNPDSIELSEDGFHYRRKIGSNEDPTEKVIYGFKSQDVANKAMSIANYEAERQAFNMSLVKESETFDLSFDGACSFVNQLSDLYDEENWRQLTPGLSSTLDKSIDVLKQNIDKAKWVKMTLDDAEYLRNNMPKIKFFKNSVF